MQSLETWYKTLKKGETIRIVYGTKGDRPRDTHVVHVERAREVIAIAIQRSKETGGKLVDKPNLKKLWIAIALL